MTVLNRTVLFYAKESQLSQKDISNIS